MCCVLCYDNHVNPFNPKTQARKCLISYYKTNGIIIFNKHVNANHAIIIIFFEKEVKWSIKKLFKGT